MSDKSEKERSQQEKKELYSILLRKENLTDTEINTMYELSQDDEIQYFYWSVLKELRNEFNSN